MPMSGRWRCLSDSPIFSARTAVNADTILLSATSLTFCRSQ